MTDAEYMEALASIGVKHCYPHSFRGKGWAFEFCKLCGARNWGYGHRRPIA